METQAKRPDRRVIKTKRAIRSAFAQLVAQKDISDITIKDIADAADINRKTFYNYYSGVYEVVEEIEDEIINAFTAVLAEVDFNTVLNNPQVIFYRLSAGIRSDLKLYSSLFIGNNTSMTQKIINTIKVKIKETFGSQVAVDPALLEVMSDYSTAGLVAVYQSWFRNDNGVSLETLTNWISKLCFGGVTGMVAANPGILEKKEQ